jgi:hypothetical protein
MPETWEVKEIAALNATYIAYLMRLNSYIETTDCLPKCLSSLVAAYADDFFFKALGRSVLFHGVVAEGILLCVGNSLDFVFDVRDLDRIRLSYMYENTRKTHYICDLSCDELWTAIQTDSLSGVVHQKRIQETQWCADIIASEIRQCNISQQIRWRARDINDEMELGVEWPRMDHAT